METSSSSYDSRKSFETGSGGRTDGGSQLASKAADTASSIADRAGKSIGSASTTIQETAQKVQETAQKIWSQPGAVASDLADTGRSAANTLARQINEQPLAAMLLAAAAVGYFASILIHGRR